MNIAVSVVVAVISAVILAEIISRLAYRLYFHLPFRDRRIGEYPYSRFLEQSAPPVYCVFKKGFRSRGVNINRFGLRGDEPALDGAKRRLLVVGESNFFGAKLRNERLLWSKRLQDLLATHGHGDWEVVNGGTPLYGSAQHWHFWSGMMAEVRPDILIVGIGGNNVAQMNVLGERWRPEAHWPFEFLLKLERKSTRWNAFLSRFCLYFFLRRFFGAPLSSPFSRGEGTLPWDACKGHILEQYRKFFDYARRKGIKIMFTTSPLLFNANVTEEDERRLAAIQSNYRDSIERDGPYFFDLMDAVARDLCPELDVPYWDLKADFMANPHCYECWLDLGHWNEKGMDWVARKLYDRIDRLGWWV
jgi:lysophospholipase L1-like esterase